MAQLFFRTNTAVNNGNTNVRGDRNAIIIVPTSVVLLNVTAAANPGGTIVDYDATTSNPIVGAQFTVSGDTYTIAAVGSAQITLAETITTPGGIPAGSYNVDPGEGILNHDIPLAQRNVITPDDLEVFATNTAGIGVDWLAADSQSTAVGIAVDNQTRQLQLQNIYLMFGPGIEVDLSGYTVDVFDNNNNAGVGRAAGFQFGGAAGDTILDGTTNQTAWNNKKARVRFNQTRYNLIRNTAGNSGAAATGSFTLALNAELLFEGTNTWITGGSGGPGVDPNTINNHGIGMHPQAGGNAGLRGITHNSTVNYPGAQGGVATGGWQNWNGANLVGSGAFGGGLTGTRGQALLGENEVNLPSITRSAAGDTLRLTSPLSLFGADSNNPTQLRSNVTGRFSEGVTFEPNELNAGGGTFNIITTSEGYVNQGNIDFPAQMVYQGEQTTNGDIVLNPRQDAIVFDGFDLGDRDRTNFSLNPGNPINLAGHFVAFKHLTYNVSKPVSISDDDAPIGGTPARTATQADVDAGIADAVGDNVPSQFGVFRAWMDNNGVFTDATGLSAANGRFINGNQLTVDSAGHSRFTSDGDLQVLQNNITEGGFFEGFTLPGFATIVNNNYPNLNRSTTTTPPGDANNAYYFEGRYNNALRYPFIWNNKFDDNFGATGELGEDLTNINGVRQLGQITTIYTQYPFLPVVSQDNPADLEYIQSVDVALSKPVYVDEDNASVVDAYDSIGSAQQALDVRYLDYLSSINEVDSLEVSILRANIDEFLEINGRDATQQDVDDGIATEVGQRILESSLGHYITDDIIAFTNDENAAILRLLSDNLNQGDINEGVPGEVGDPVENTILKILPGATITGDFTSSFFIENVGTGAAPTFTGVLTAPALDTNNLILTGDGNALRYNNFAIRSGVDSERVPLHVHNIPTFRRSCDVNITGAVANSSYRLGNIFGPNFSVGNLPDGVVITISSDVAINIEIAQADRVHFDANNLNVTFIEPTTDAEVVVPTNGRLYVERLNAARDAVLGTQAGIEVTAGQTLTYSYANSEAMERVRIYYAPDDTSFYPRVQNATLSNFNLDLQPRPSALYSDVDETSFTERPTTTTAIVDGQAILTLTINRDFNRTQGPINQRYFLLAIGTTQYFNALFELNRGNTDTTDDATFISNLVDGAANNSTVYDGRYVTLSSDTVDEAIANAVPRRTFDVVNVDPNDPQRQSIARFLNLPGFDTVDIDATSGLINESQNRVTYITENSKNLENQVFIYEALQELGLRIPLPSDLPIGFNRE